MYSEVEEEESQIITCNKNKMLEDVDPEGGCK